MSILDDAIREHLELKRAHGADDAELKKLEDEAFGPPARPEEPDPYAEAPTEFLVAPGSETPAAGEDDGGRRVPNITDLQEAPVELAEPSAPPEPDDPAEEEQPAGEHEPIADTGPSTEERHAIASQPTEIFDVEGQFEDAATEADAPSDEQLVDAELAEPRLAPVDPIAGIEASGPAEADAPAAEEEHEDEFDEFFSEQRLSDELNQALEAPLPDEPGAPATEEATAIYEVEVAEVEAADETAPAEEPSEEYEIVELDSEEMESAEAEQDAPAAPAAEEDDDAPIAEPPRAANHEDVLEDTPEFLEDAPEDDNLWFEQKPPKDIDFGD
jgi:hypothetical protein